MTQPPQLPPMPPPEPLDEAERALARALRNLPTATPPPELDARILGTARRAMHLATPRKRDNRRWLVGFGTAASALLAIGVLLKTHGPAQDAVYTPPEEATPANAPAADTAAASAPMQDGKDKSPIAADAAEPSGAASQAASGVVSDTLAQPLEESLRARAPQSLGGTAATETKTSPQAFPVRQLPKPIAPPAPAPPPVVMDEPMPMAVQSPAPSAPRVPALERDEAKDQRYSGSRRDAEADQMSSGAPAAAGAVFGQTAQDQGVANKVAANAASSSAPAPKQNALDKVTVTGARLKKETSSNLPAPSDDATLNPAEWIERVRERLRSGDRAGASASLHAFVRAHPDASIPDDLQQLLR